MRLRYWLAPLAILLSIRCGTSDGGQALSPASSDKRKPVATKANTRYDVLVSGHIAPGTGFGVGIDDAAGQRRWLTESEGHLTLTYPGRLGWAALFITVDGPAVPPPRPHQDFSGYRRIALEMRGKRGGECVMIGVKDYDDPDDGTEPKVPVSLTSEWSTFTVTLTKFAQRHPARSQLDLGRLYVVTEFVFPCDAASNEEQAIEVRSVTYLR